MKSGKTSQEPFRFSLSTRTNTEQSYLAELEKAFVNSPFSAVEKLMNFPLYVPRQDLTKFIIKYEIFKRILGQQGSIVECGVMFGGGTLSFAQFSAILEPTNHQRRIIGFDSFSGFKKLAQQDSKSESKEAFAGGMAIDSYSEIQRCARLYDMNRFVGHIPKIELIKGDACKTIPRFVKDNPHLIVSLLYLDFDVYAPTKTALEQFVPRMHKGSIIAFDELNLKDWPGETQAVLNALDIERYNIERFPFGSTISFASVE